MHSNVMVRTLCREKVGLITLGRSKYQRLSHTITSYYSKKTWILNHLAVVHILAISFVSLYTRYVSFQPELMGNSEREMKGVKKTEDKFLIGFVWTLK